MDWATEQINKTFAISIQPPKNVQKLLKYSLSYKLCNLMVVIVTGDLEEHWKMN